MANDFTAPDPERIDTAADFFRELRTLRERSGLTIREVARISQTRVSTTGDYFSGRHLPLDRRQFARVLAACGEKDQARIEQWQTALSRARRMPGRRGDPPYRGLARFEPQDEQWFFGRTDVTDQLAALAQLPSGLPLLLVGPSGAGKSSLLRAGLVPRLRSLAGAPEPTAENAEDGPVHVYDLTATGAAELAVRVAELAAKAAGTTAEGTVAEPAAAAESARTAGRTGPDGTPVLIVDQFEAIFTLCTDEKERRALIGALCDLARDSLVVLTLRADFYGQAIRYPRLTRALQERQVVLGPMTAAQVRQAVVEPARLARADVADGLVDVVLADLAPHQGMEVADTDSGTDGGTDSGQVYEPGALPLLSHALLAAWEHSHGGTLTVADYLAGGGIKNALTQSAERAYASLAPGEQRLARRLFLRLVHLADELPPSRASVSLNELRAILKPDGGGEVTPDGGGADRVLAVFIDERMITVDTDAAQLTHDALLAGWPRLRTWIEESAEELRVRRRISLGARAWAEAGREEAALWRGSQLAIAREWAADHDKRVALLPVAREFVDASVAADAAREQRERTRTRRLRSIIAVLTVLVLAVAGLTGYAFNQRQAAANAEASAITAEHTAITRGDQADSREIAFVADQVRTENPAVAAQLSLSGYRFARTPEATASVLASAGAPIVARIEDTAGVAQWVSLSPSRRLLVAAAGDGTLRLWNVAVPGHPAAVATLLPANKNQPLYTAAFSPDGKLIAAAGADRIVHLWTVSGNAAAGSASGAAGNGTLRVAPVGQPLTGPTSTIYSVAFSPDGRMIAVGSADGTVRLWNIADPVHPAPVGRPITVGGAAGASAYVQSVAFSPDGQTLAAGTSAGTVWLWDMSRPAAPVPFRAMPLSGPADVVSGVTFSPDGRTLAASDHDRKVWLWTVHARRGGAGTAVPDGTLASATNWANTVAFSPDGRFLAVGTSGARVQVWNLATRTVSAALPQPQPVTSVTWDGSGRIAASDADGDIELWALPSPILDTANAPDAIAYSPDGRTLAIGGSSVQLWDVATRALLATRRLPSRVGVNSVTFRPRAASGHAGAVLAAALSNGTIVLLNGRTLAPLGAPLRVISGSGQAQSVAFSPDGELLATGGDDGTLRLFDVTDPVHPRQLAVGRGTTSAQYTGNSVYTVAFAPDGTTIATASLDDTVRLWHVSREASPGQARLTRVGPVLGKMSSYAIGLAFSRDGKVLAVGSADKTVHLWNVASPARPVLDATLTGPAGYVWAAAFSPDGKTLAAGVTDGSVWLWNVSDPMRPVLKAALTGLPDHVYAVAFSPSGGQLAATSFEGTVHLWDTSPAAARATVCANLGQPLTRTEWESYLPGVPYRAPC